jgi:phosphoribosyl-ATP pyrophosphohydrolase
MTPSDPNALAEVLGRLEAVIAARRGADAASSYTAQLLADPARAAKKFGEEAVEVVIAAVSGDQEALVAESADALYHWLALLAACGVPISLVAERLAAREGRSGLEEKASRPSDPPTLRPDP